METDLERVLCLARNKAGNDKYGGCASVKVEFHPYECGWFAEANWSENVFVQSACFENASFALAALIGLLQNSSIDPVKRAALAGAAGEAAEHE
jgi:hypothetical protein